MENGSAAAAAAGTLRGGRKQKDQFALGSAA